MSALARERDSLLHVIKTYEETFSAHKSLMDEIKKSYSDAAKKKNQVIGSDGLSLKELSFARESTHTTPWLNVAAHYACREIPLFARYPLMLARIFGRGTRGLLLHMHDRFETTSVFPGPGQQVSASLIELLYESETFFVFHIVPLSESIGR